MDVFRYLSQGGMIYMVSITVSALLMLFFSANKITRMVIEKKFDLTHLNFILVFGSASLIIGLLEQGIGLSQVMQIISNEDVQGILLNEGIRVTLIAPIYGLAIFLVSLIIWAILKEINLRKM